MAGPRSTRARPSRRRPADDSEQRYEAVASGQQGKLAARRRATAAGLLRAGGGRRVSTENVSNAACPARPSLRRPSASKVRSWCSWSATASATATLVSTKSSAVLALAGIAKRANEIVVYLRATRRNDKPPLALLEGIARERLYAQPGAVCGHLYFPRSEADVVAQRLRDYQSSCLVNGCTYA